MLRIAPLLAVCATFASCAPLITKHTLPVKEPREVEARSTPWETIGESLGGRAVRAKTVGLGGKRIALIAGIHGDEQEGLRHLDEVMPILGSARATIRVIEDCNPDGTAAHRRTTSSGVDPNRNWPARSFRRDPRNGPDPLSEPAVAAAHADLVRFRPELIVVLHSARSGPFVNYDGPAEAEAATFARGAGWKVKPSMGYPTPGSIGSYFGIDQRVPILTIEFKRGDVRANTGPALDRGLRSLLGVAAAPNREPPGDAYRVL